MSKDSSFWQSVSELAAMRDHIPEDRRAFAGVREALRLDNAVSASKNDSAPRRKPR